MRTNGMMWIAASALVTVHPGFAADVVSWGSAVNGVRLGISLDSAPSVPELDVFLQNVGAAGVDIPIGRLVGKGTAVDFRFTAAAPDGKEQECFEINTFTPLAALTLPVVVHLSPGGTHESHFPLNKISCIEKPGDIKFEKLLPKQRCSVHVSLETIFLGTDDKNVEWFGVAHPWIGKVISGELAPPR
jgi:hypothetical protein